MNVGDSNAGRRVHTTVNGAPCDCIACCHRTPTVTNVFIDEAFTLNTEELSQRIRESMRYARTKYRPTSEWSFSGRRFGKAAAQEAQRAEIIRDRRFALGIVDGETYDVANPPKAIEAASECGDCGNSLCPICNPERWP